MSVLDSIKRQFGIIGNSPGLIRALEKAIRIAPTNISALVTGESGVGKENIPKIIHQLSARKHNQYIAVNCGAIPEGTIDSELFGHEKGAFTGATSLRKGYFEVANGGTIFLDEVGDLPLSTQVRLLRVLETGEFLKVGSSKAQKTDIRIIAATNAKLLESIQKGRFREDLYYRLNTVEIKLPPLRERREDIHLLFRKFASDFSDKYKMPAVSLSPEAIHYLESFNWPGNIRQLRNLSEQLSVLETERMIGVEVIQNYIPKVNQSTLPSVLGNQNTSESNSNFQNEREILYKVLFDMRKDINELKNITAHLTSGSENRDFSSENIPPTFSSNTGQKLLEAPKSAISSSESDVDSSFQNNNTIDIEETKSLENNEQKRRSLHDVELEMITSALSRNKGKRKLAAEELGISERTLYRKIKQYDL